MKSYQIVNLIASIFGLIVGVKLFINKTYESSFCVLLIFLINIVFLFYMIYSDNKREEIREIEVRKIKEYYMSKENVDI